MLSIWMFIVILIDISGYFTEELPYTTIIRRCQAKEDNLTVIESCTNPIDVKEFYLNNEQNNLLSGGIFSKCTSLTDLILSNTALRYVNKDLFIKLNKLITLNLSNNQIDVLDSASFGKIPKLKRLLLRSNNINKIDSDTFNGLGELMEVHLDNNLLNSTIINRSVFSKLKKLNKINLAFNRVEVLNKESFGKIANLQILLLHDNDMSKIDSDTFKHLPKLTNLYLQNNKLDFISENAFSTANNLEYLDLRYNKLQNLHFLSVLVRMQYLNLSHNKIATLETDTFANLRDLIYLQLQNNSIDQLPLNIFKTQQRLIQLDLSHNRIIKIETGTFAVNFRELLINDNKIEVSAALNNISEVYLQRNFLRKLPLPNNKVILHIDGNQWDCEFVRQAYANPDVTLNHAFIDDRKNVRGVACNDMDMDNIKAIGRNTFFTIENLLIIACTAFFIIMGAVIYLYWRSLNSKPPNIPFYRKIPSSRYDLPCTPETEAGYLTPRPQNIYEEIPASTQCIGSSAC